MVQNYTQKNMLCKMGIDENLVSRNIYEAGKQSYSFEQPGFRLIGMLLYVVHENTLNTK